MCIIQHTEDKSRQEGGGVNIADEARCQVPPDHPYQQSQLDASPRWDPWRHSAPVEGESRPSDRGYHLLAARIPQFNPGHHRGICWGKDSPSCANARQLTSTGETGQATDSSGPKRTTHLGKNNISMWSTEWHYNVTSQHACKLPTLSHLESCISCSVAMSLKIGRWQIPC